MYIYNVYIYIYITPIISAHIETQPVDVMWVRIINHFVPFWMYWHVCGFFAVQHSFMFGF